MHRRLLPTLLIDELFAACLGGYLHNVIVVLFPTVLPWLLHRSRQCLFVLADGMSSSEVCMLEIERDSC